MRTEHTERLAHLDGLRGVAIASVVLFHAYARWGERLPYGNTFTHVPPIELGWLGVYLFFMVSGFVIFMTLERCPTWSEFAWRRWLRLFPAMLIASFLIFLTAPFLTERPAGHPTLMQLWSGLLFASPDWLQTVGELFISPTWQRIFGVRVEPIEAAFWTLFVEVQFYAIAGFTYYRYGMRGALATMLGLFALALILKFAGAASNTFNGPKLVSWIGWWAGMIGIEHYGWFLAGALFYLSTRERYRHEMFKEDLIIAASAIGILAALNLLVERGATLNGRLGALVVVAIFALAVVHPKGRQIASHPVLVFLGFISYPLYLVHENMMVAIMIKLAAAAPWLPGILLPILPIATVVGLAWVIATYLELPLKTYLRTNAPAWLAAMRNRVSIAR
jgi:peptidoglycan/LPS O-acetylase OafA/YrhL